MTQLQLTPIYLIDSSCVINLDNKHRRPNDPPEFNDVEREIIWNGLETLANDGFLKLIKQVRGELSDWHPIGLQRLAVFPRTSYVLRRSPELVLEYQRVVQTYPDLIRKSKRPDPADPWLITIAKLRKLSILTEELDISARSSTASKWMRIPDVCAKEVIQCWNLRKLANDQGWLH